MRIALARLAVAGSAVAAVFAGTAVPAMAGEAGVMDTNKTISNDHGYMTYIDDGDMFVVCDTKADGHGMTGIVQNPKAIPLDKLVITDGGDAGCDKGGIDITNSSDYRMKLTWDGGGLSVYSEWFNE
ncbi:hypothetical protein AB0I06_18205 [Streptomyces sp. NPDC050674]|uniref:hypothetical protein n=1 Tax=Streptomyces sp. NPDC050674 TaxID=3157216 RepID=UPI0034467E86